MKHPPWITVAVIVYGAWVSSYILGVWVNSPLDHYSWVALAIWLTPVKQWTSTLSRGQAVGVGVAILVVFLGLLASLNSVKLLGLAIAIVSLVPWTFGSLFWLLSALSWMPGMSWAAIHLFPHIGGSGILLMRVAIACAGLWMMRLLKSKSC